MSAPKDGTERRCECRHSVTQHHFVDPGECQEFGCDCAAYTPEERRATSTHGGRTMSITFPKKRAPKVWVLALVLAGLAIWLSPIVAIWCVNTLFGTAIETTLATWFAALLLIGLIGR